MSYSLDPPSASNNGEAQSEPEYTTCMRCRGLGVDRDDADCLACMGTGEIELR